MKKNLRIVSAAAAALLAVAPVAVSVVSTADAADDITTGGATKPQQEHRDHNIDFASNLGNQDLDKAGFSSFVDLNNFNLSNFLKDVGSKISVSANDGSKPEIVATDEAQITKKATDDTNAQFQLKQSDLHAGSTYYLQVAVTVRGLSKDTNIKYTANNGAVYLPNNGQPSSQGTIRNIYLAIPLHFYNSTLHDQPSFGSTYLKNNALANGQTIEAPKTVKINNKDTKVSVNDSATVLAAIEKLGLSSNRSSYATGIQAGKTNVLKYDASNTDFVKDWANYSNTIYTPVDKPDKDRPVTNSFSSRWTPGSDTYTLKRVNIFSGKFATVTVAFNKNSEDLSFPLIQYRTLTGELNNEGKDWFSVKQANNTFNTAMPVATVKLGDSNWAETVLNHFRALQSSNNNDKLRLTTDNLHVDNMNVNQSGLYNATLKATNSNGKTTTLNFQVAVSGDKKDELANYFVSAENGQVVNLVSIVNGTVSNQNGVVANNGQQIVVYPNDTTTVNGVEYTRVASVGKTREASNLWIPTKNLKAAVEKKLEKTGTVKVMHNSYVYNEKHERVGSRVIATYSNVDVYGTKEINGKKFYRISADKEEYIDAANVDGTKRTLKHNAYIYATSKKRANKKVLKKGTTVTTYGSAVKFRNGKAYYRIEGCTASNKMYVKKANF
ncbi:SLAP domain-containing protein [Lactobacillus sp. PSON]|uniref:SLAP domain-containing protein n=1 Tax=Lactobacillus sp. PSON TaxID=3455454 RepID=UPI0040415CC6